MTLDEHTPCPACPHQVRALYAVGRRMLSARAETLSAPEAEEFLAALEALRPFVDAHHANQLHAFSLELEEARAPQLTEATHGTAG